MYVALPHVFKDMKWLNTYADVHINLYLLHLQIESSRQYNTLNDVRKRRHTHTHTHVCGNICFCHLLEKLKYNRREET